MRIRIDGTYAELVHAANTIRKVLPIGSVSPIFPLHERPHTWRVFLNTAPRRDTGSWTA
jgi:hypothetical protein